MARHGESKEPFWRRIIGRQTKSGLTARAWGGRHDMSETSFFRGVAGWREVAELCMRVDQLACPEDLLPGSLASGRRSGRSSYRCESRPIERIFVGWPARLHRDHPRRQSACMLFRRGGSVSACRCAGRTIYGRRRAPHDYGTARPMAQARGQPAGPWCSSRWRVRRRPGER